MGVTAENLAAEYGITRADQDQFAARSQQHWTNAQKQEALKVRSCPYPSRKKAGRPSLQQMSIRAPGHRRAVKSAQTGVQERRDRDRRQCFGNQRWGRCVAVDDRRRGQGARAGTAGLPPGHGQCWRRSPHYGYRPGPSYPQLLAQTETRLEDVDRIELNEAFAAQSLAVGRSWIGTGIRSTSKAEPLPSATGGRCQRRAHLPPRFAPDAAA